MTDERCLDSLLRESKFSRIVSEFKQWREPENRPYFDHYLMNVLKIAMGVKPVDYRTIGHNNILVHSFMYIVDDQKDNISSRNKLVNSSFYDPQTARR